MDGLLCLGFKARPVLAAAHLGSCHCQPHNTLGTAVPPTRAD
jgi:hypothetical protein